MPLIRLDCGCSYDNSWSESRPLTDYTMHHAKLHFYCLVECNGTYDDLWQFESRFTELQQGYHPSTIWKDSSELSSWPTRAHLARAIDLERSLAVWRASGCLERHWMRQILPKLVLFERPPVPVSVGVQTDE